VRFQPIQELNIHAGAIDAAQKLPGASSGVLLIAEMAGPIGIPDFTAIVGGRDRIAARLSSGIAPILSPLESSIVSRFHVSRPRRPTDVAIELSMTESAARARVRKLIRQGALIETATQAVTRHPSLTPGGSVYAIEAKVRDWKRAVRQSRRYRVWANSYVIALGTLGSAPRASVIGEVRDDAAGLIVDGKWVIKPSPRPVNAHYRMLTFEHIVDALAHAQPSLAMKVSTPDSSGPIHWSPAVADPVNS
jgi:hypothetical protein